MTLEVLNLFPLHFRAVARRWHCPIGPHTLAVAASVAGGSALTVGAGPASVSKVFKSPRIQSRARGPQRHSVAPSGHPSVLKYLVWLRSSTLNVFRATDLSAGLEQVEPVPGSVESHSIQDLDTQAHLSHCE
jgi:hypothetical protein